MSNRALIIDALIDRLTSLPAAAQEEAVDSLLAIEARHAPTYRTSPDERAAILRGLAQADAGQVVGDEEVAAFFARHGL